MEKREKGNQTILILQLPGTEEYIQPKGFLYNEYGV